MSKTLRIRDLVRGGYVTVEELRHKFSQMQPKLLRYPAIDAEDFRKKIEDFLKGSAK